MATKREDLYGRFGPELIEAVVKMVLDEINILRVEASLPERTTQQVMTALETKLDGLADMDWTPA